MTKTEKMTRATEAYNVVYVVATNSQYDSSMARHTTEQAAQQKKERWAAADAAKAELVRIARENGLSGIDSDLRGSIGKLEIANKTYTGAILTLKSATAKKVAVAAFAQRYDARERNF